MKILRKILVVLLVLFALFLLAAGGVGVYVNGKYGVFTAAPAVTHTDVTDAHPTIRAVLNPLLASEFAGDLIEEWTGRSVPGWLLEYIMPGEISLILTSDHDSSKILASFFVNEKRLGPVFAEVVNDLDLPELYPQFQWDPEGIQLEERGRLTIGATVPMEPHAQDAVWNDGWWTHGRRPRPLRIEGGHLLEVIGDNRQGGAYLAVASLMDAFGYDLDAQMEDVSITSFVFVERADIYVDLTGDDGLSLYLSFEIQEGKETKIAVVNLKAGLGQLFENWQEVLAKEHDLALEGGSRWEGTTLIFEFTLSETGRALRTLLNAR